MGIFNFLAKKNVTSSPTTPVLPDPAHAPVLENPFSGLRLTETPPPNTASTHTTPTDELDPELAAARFKPKRKLSLPSLSHLLGEHQHLIVFQAGSFGLRGALVRNEKHKASITHVAESRKVDFTQAIAELLHRLKQTHKRLPKRAILLTPSVITTQVDLPVSPLRPRTDAEMQELIRWEMESAVTQQNKHWMIGSMLVERGYLTPIQRDTVLNELEIRQQQSGPASLIRFGDLAIQLNLIDREQLEECFTLQGKLLAVDDDLVYGWQASEVLRNDLSDEILLSQEDDSDSSHPWLVCGMSQTVRRRWIGAFNLNGIHIEAFYSSLGSAFSNLNSDRDQEQSLLEIHQEQLALIRGTGYAITHISTTERPQGLDSVTACLNLIGAELNDATPLNLISYCNDSSIDLAQDLTDSLGMDVLPFSMPLNGITLPPNIDNDALLSIQGAVNHYLGHTPVACLTWVNAQEAQEPTWKKLTKPKNIAIAASIILVCSANAFIGWMYWNTQRQTQRLTDLEQQFNSEIAVKKRLQAIYQENLQLKASIDALIHEKVLTDTLISHVEKNRSYRIASTAPLLKSMTLGVSMDIALTEIEKQQDQYHIQAIASDNNSASEYVNTLNRFVKPLNYQVIKSDGAEDGTLGVQLITIDLDYQPDLALSLLSNLQGDAH